MSSEQSEVTSFSIETISELESLADEWLALQKRSCDREVMQSPLWLLPWWKHYGRALQLRVWALRDGERLVALFPLYARNMAVWPSLASVRLAFMGTGEREADETCSEYVGPIVEQGYEQLACEKFAEALRTGGLGAWDELWMTAMSSESVLPPLLARSLGKAVEYRVLGGAPFAELPNSWDEYLKGLSSSRRYLIRRSFKAWKEWTGVEASLHSASSLAEVEANYEKLKSLHNTRWRSQGRPGAFESEIFDSFHKEVIANLFENDNLWISWLEKDGELVACLYSFVWNNQVRFYQSGRILETPKKVRPGLVIHACAMREAINRGYSHYDFLAGTTRYKMQLATNVRPLLQLRLQAPGIRTKLRNLQEKGAGLARSLRDEVQRRRGG